MKRRDLTAGLILILIGVSALLDYFLDIQIFSMQRLWPLFILIPGLSMEFSFIRSRRDPGILVPGGILTTLGFLFLFETFTSWHFAGYTWPIYPLAVAIGLYQLYVFGGRQRALLIPVFILSSFSIIAFSSMMWGSLMSWLNRKLMVAVVLIVIGIVYAFRGLSNKSNNNNNTGAM